MAETGPSVVVLGSAHMDLIASAARMPERGESVAGGSFSMSPGGKAGNQACQLALAGGHVEFIGRLGADLFGRQLLDALAGRGVGTRHVAIDADVPTGASTVLAAEGDYTSIIAPGAAARLGPADIEAARAAIEAADALVLQLEIPAEISATAAAIARAAGRAVVLNASPAPATWSELPEALRLATAVLVVNRVEAGRLLGRALDGMTVNTVLRELSALTAVPTIVVTLGAEGSAAISAGTIVEQPGFKAIAIEAVGAGDAFLGAVVIALLEGLALQRALQRGAAAGAITVGRRGVYDALPTRAEIDAFLAAPIPAPRPPS